MSTPRAERPHMPDYGVDTPSWAPLEWSWAAQRLAENRNFWVVTVSAAGRPHAMPVWGVWDDEALRFAFCCASGSRKARNLAENPACVIALDDTVECLSVEGTAAAVPAGEQQEGWIDHYLRKYQRVSADLSREFLQGNAMFEVTPERAFAVIEREEEFATRATRWSFGAG